MYKLVQYFVIFLILISLSCSNENNENDNNVSEIADSLDQSSFEAVDKSLQEEKKLEVYTVEKKAVVFFIISKREAQILTSEVGETYEWEIEALLNSFTEQAKAFMEIMKKQNINSILSTSKRFEIKKNNGKTITFDRIKEDQILGEILTNGVKEPLICYGKYSHKELAELIQNYFNIENLGNIPSDTLNVEFNNPDSSKLN